MSELTGKQKSQLLISLLEDNSSEVLKHLSEESSNKLSSSLEDIPSLLDEEMKDFLNNILSKIDELQTSSDIDMLGESNLESSEISDLDINKLDNDEDNDLDISDDDLFEEEKKETKFPENYNSPDVVAEKLKLQEDQLIAFFFHYFDDELADEVKEYFEVERIEQIYKIDVELNPMSKKIYDKLFNIIVLKTDNSQLPDDVENSNDDSDILNQDDEQDLEYNDDDL